MFQQILLDSQFEQLEDKRDVIVFPSPVLQFLCFYLLFEAHFLVLFNEPVSVQMVQLLHQFRNILVFGGFLVIRLGVFGNLTNNSYIKYSY